MRVTNEQIDAEIICANSKGCSGCQREGDDCSQVTESNIAAFLDLKEARELIKEMRGIINSAVCMDYDPNCDCTGCNDVGGQMQSILEKSKDYA